MLYILLFTWTVKWRMSLYPNALVSVTGTFLQENVLSEVVHYCTAASVLLKLFSWNPLWAASSQCIKAFRIGYFALKVSSWMESTLCVCPLLVITHSRHYCHDFSNATRSYISRSFIKMTCFYLFLLYTFYTHNPWFPGPSQVWPHRESKNLLGWVTVAHVWCLISLV